MPPTVGLTRLYYHCDHPQDGTQSHGRRTILLPRGATLRTDTWFNGFFERYWREYTNLRTLELRACVSGTGILRIYRRSAYQPAAPARESLAGAAGWQPSLLREIDFTGESRELRIEIADTLPPHEAAGLLFFEIVSQSSPVILHRAEWIARDVSAKPTQLVAGYCTFNRASLLLANVAALLEDTEVAEVLARVAIVDQGEQRVRAHPDYALLAESAGDRLQLVEQDNFGGAGGFTRCLLEATEIGNATHVLLMDDDAVIEPECVLRAAAFLSLARQDLAVGGYMLDQRRPRELFEVGSRYSPERMRIDEPICHRVDRPDGLTPFLDIRHGHFNGWWFFAFPLALLDHVGLPLPLFLRGDDVEFGYRLLRAGVPTAFLPGVAVWHESFELKGRGWQPFYELRNLLIIGALHFPPMSGANRARRFFSRLLDELLIYDYYESWLLCEAVAAYLHGPKGLRIAPRLVHDRLLAAGENLASRTQPRASGLRMGVRARPPSSLTTIRARRLWLVLRNAVLPSPPRDTPPRNVIRADGEQWYTVSDTDVLAVDETSRKDLVILRRSRGRFVWLLLRGLWLALRLFGSHRRTVRRWRKETPAITTPQFWGEYLAFSTSPERERRDSTPRRSRSGLVGA